MADFDAIVVGSGISGGWVAKELCERGLKVCVIDRGRPTNPAQDYSDHLDPWEKPHFDQISDAEMKRDYFIQGQYYALKNSNKHFFLTDREQPYERAPNQSFQWRRGNYVGGRSLVWGRAVYRLSDYDFNANKAEGVGVDWPIRYKDIAPWYDHVEKFIGVAGNRDGVPQVPDGKHFLPAFEHTCVETDMKEKLKTLYPERKLIMGRVAHLTHLSDEQIALGRGKCQARNLCFHGCSYGAYFSSVSATLPAAERTGNLTLIPNAVVSRLVHDKDKNRVTGVHVVDRDSGVGTTYTGKLVFLNASSIASALILMNSATEDSPTGLANSSDQLGRNLMDHIKGTMVEGVIPGFEDKYVYGRRPIGGYIPRYRNFPAHVERYKRGWGYQVYSGRGGWGGWHQGIGESFKAKNRNPGPWTLILHAFGECLPDETNRVTAHASKVDKWGQPIAVVDLKLDENGKALMQAAHQDAIEMLTKYGASYIREIQKPEDNMNGISGAVHEMGTARMGRDPKTSVLNQWNQAHDIPNLFITDGSFMTSSATQNPSLTYMAFSARAANYAADLLQAGEF